MCTGDLLAWELKVAFLILLFPLLIVVIWVLIIQMDKERVTQSLSEQGGKVIRITWRIFGHGWMSEASKNGGGNRIYEVEYTNMYGERRHVWAKTALWSGVYLAKDTGVGGAAGSGQPMSQEQKIAFLEEQLHNARRKG